VVQRICKAAGVPKVSAHGMRGLHGTLAVDSGITSHAVASALGHESFKTTAAHYAKREAVAGAQQKRALAVLTGGRGWRHERRPHHGVRLQSFPKPYFQRELNRNRSAFVELNGIEPSASSMPFRGDVKKNQ
jgi:hypothetical protein